MAVQLLTNICLPPYDDTFVVPPIIPVRRNVSRYAAMNVELLNVASGLTRPVIVADVPGDRMPLPTQVQAAWTTDC
jgi:hypothetical protein